MNNDLIARRLKPPTPPAASLPSSPGPPPATPPPFAPQPAPYAPTSTPFERSDVPWDRPAEPEQAVSTEPTVEQDWPPTPEAAVEPEAVVADVELPPTIEPEAAVAPEPEAVVADVELPPTIEPEAAITADAPTSTTPWPPTVAALLAEAASRFNGADEFTVDAAAAFVPDAEFVSVVPPWESPPDEAWLVDAWAPAGPPRVEIGSEGEPATEAAAPALAEPEPVEPEPEPAVEMADEAVVEFAAEVSAEPAAEPAAEPLAELVAEPIAEGSEAVDEVVDASPSLDLRLLDIGSWTPHAPDTASPLGDLPDDGDMVVADETAPADPNDAFAPLAEDLLTVDTVEPLTHWPGRDIAATMVVAHKPDETDLVAPAAQDAEIAGTYPDTQAVVHDSLFAWEPAPAGPSVFGEMPAAVEPPPVGQSPASDVFAPRAAETAEPIHAEPFAVAQPEPPAPPPNPVDWPPVPTGVFPPLPDALPTLNVESVPDDGIAWPDDPRPQTFWPADAPAVHANPAPDDAWVPAPPVLAAGPSPAEPELRFVPPPTMVAGVGSGEERPRLVFAEPLPPSAERDGRDGVLTRIGNQATAFAERLPEGWSLPTAPTLTSTNEEAMARDLKDIQSPTLTVLFAIVAIAAVLLFVYLVTPLLR